MSNTDTDNLRIYTHEADYYNVASDIAKYYGLDAQINQCIQECAELIKALTDFKRACGLGQPLRSGKGIVSTAVEVLDEIADVQVMLFEMMSLVNQIIPEGDSREIIENTMCAKLIRTLSSMDSTAVVEYHMHKLFHAKESGDKNG